MRLIVSNTSFWLALLLNAVDCSNSSCRIIFLVCVSMWVYTSFRYKVILTQLSSQKIDNSPLILHRGAAANCLRFCIWHCPLAESLSATRTAEALEKLLQWTILGSDRDAAELQQPDKVWQTRLFSGQVVSSGYREYDPPNHLLDASSLCY